MKKLVSGIVVVSLCACSADPGYEPRYEPHESQLAAQPETPPQTTTRSIEAPRKLVVAMQVCADKFALRLPKTSDSYAVMYDLTVTGDSITAKVKDSQFPGTELEKCLTNVLEHMDVPDSVLSTSQVSPRSRSAVGIVQAAAVPIAMLPIILIAGGVTILVGVTIIVLAHAADDVAAEKERCRQVKEFCISKCTEETIPTGTFNGDPFFQCRRRCLEAENCW